jgi:hypothetical protein
MRVILHIGQSKTGTTSLQSFLASNRASLAKGRILYPDVYRRGIPLNVLEHNSFAEALCGFRRFPALSAEEYFSQFLKQAEQSKCDTLLLSGESFWGAPQIWRLDEGVEFFEAHATKLKNLKQLLGKSECHVVLYLRRQDEWMDSTIPQIIRYAGLMKQSIYENDAQTMDLLAPHLDYATLLGLWEKIIKPSEMTVIPFERDHLTGGDTVTDFINRIGVADCITSLKSKETREHASLSREFILLKKTLNRIPKNKTEERTIIGILTDLDIKMGSNLKYEIAPELNAKLTDRMSSTNKTLARQYGGNGPVFFSTPGGSKKLSSDTHPNGVSLEDGMAAVIAFDNTYVSFTTALKRFKIASASFLRRNCPPLHALARRIFLSFQR